MSAEGGESPRRTRRGARGLKKKALTNTMIFIKKVMFALAMRGAGAKPLQKRKDDVILRSARRPLCDEGSRDTRIVLRVSRCCAKKSAMNNRKMNDKELC